MELFRTGTGNILKKIEEEKASGEINADIIWLADFSSMEKLKEMELMEKYISKENKNIIPIFVDEEGYYSGTRLLNMVIAFNTNSIKENPKNYKGLLSPKLKGKVGIVNPNNSGSSLYTVGTLFLNKKYRWEYFINLYQNNCRVVKNNTALSNKIASGELLMGIVIDFSVRKFMKENPMLPIDYIYPQDGIIVVASPIGITKNCRDKKSSRLFIDWILSKECQEYLSHDIGIAPVRNDVDTPKTMVPLSQLRIIPSNPKLIRKNQDKILELFNDIFSGKPVKDLKIDLVEK